MAKHVYLSAKLQFHFERLWAETQCIGLHAAWQLSKRIMFDLISPPLIFPLCLGLPFYTSTQAEMKKLFGQMAA